MLRRGTSRTLRRRNDAIAAARRARHHNSPGRRCGGPLCGAERHSCSWAVWFVRAFSVCRCGGDAGCVLAYRTGDSPGCVVRGEALSGVRHSSPGIVARRCSSAPVLLHDCECRTLRRISVRPVPPDTPGVRASVCPGIRTSARYEAARCRRSAGRARPAN